jgi:hypothetical protein
MATYNCQFEQLRNDTEMTYKVEHGASQDTIHCEVDATKHKVQSMEAKVAQQSFLQPAHLNGRVDTNVKMTPPLRKAHLDLRLELWSVVHDNNQVKVRVNICQEVITPKPRRASVFGIMYLQIRRHFFKEVIQVFVMLSHRRIESPRCRFFSFALLHHGI